MHNIHIAGTGIWYPDNLITNDELVKSYNSYVDEFNEPGIPKRAGTQLPRMQSDAFGARTHALTEWRLEPPP